MTIFDELEKQYNEIDLEYSRDQYKAFNRGWHLKEAEFQRKRELNDQAYFLYMFSRLEDRIRHQSTILIVRKQDSIQSWRSRASWDILPNTLNSKMYFKNRVALLVEKGRSDYTLICDYYDKRNLIAHGSFVSSISMPSVIPDLKRLYKEVKV